MKIILTAMLAVTATTSVPAYAQTSDREYRQDARDERRADRRDYRRYREYDHDRPEPGTTSYEADRYYRDDPSYRPRRLASNERVYRGKDERYYCRRNDGTTGLIVGGVAGGVLGNVIAPGGSGLLGTLLGAGGGALAGRAVDRGRNDGLTCK